jgi:hypothetical protein
LISTLIFSLVFFSVLSCQGDIWKFNQHTKEWDGNPVFDGDYKMYFESLKNRENRTGTSNQALPMLPRDLKIHVDFLDGAEAEKHMSETQHLYFKVFATTAFCLWTQ